MSEVDKTPLEALMEDIKGKEAKPSDLGVTGVSMLAGVKRMVDPQIEACFYELYTLVKQYGVNAYFELESELHAEAMTVYAANSRNESTVSHGAGPPSFYGVEKRGCPDLAPIFTKIKEALIRHNINAHKILLQGESDMESMTFMDATWAEQDDVALAAMMEVAKASSKGVEDES